MCVYDDEVDEIMRDRLKGESINYRPHTGERTIR